MDATNRRTNYIIAREALDEHGWDAVHDALLYNVYARREWTRIKRAKPLLADLIEKGIDAYIRQLRHIERERVENKSLNIERWREATARGMRRGGPRLVGEIEDFLAWQLYGGVSAGEATIEEWTAARDNFQKQADGAMRSARICSMAITMLQHSEAETLADLVSRRGAAAITPLLSERNGDQPSR